MQSGGAEKRGVWVALWRWGAERACREERGLWVDRPLRLGSSFLVEAETVIILDEGRSGREGEGGMGGGWGGHHHLLQQHVGLGDLGDLDALLQHLGDQRARDLALLVELERAHELRPLGQLRRVAEREGGGARQPGEERGSRDVRVMRGVRGA